MHKIGASVSQQIVLSALIGELRLMERRKNLL